MRFTTKVNLAAVGVGLVLGLCSCVPDPDDLVSSALTRSAPPAAVQLASVVTVPSFVSFSPVTQDAQVIPTAHSVLTHFDVIKASYDAQSQDAVVSGGSVSFPDSLSTEWDVRGYLSDQKLTVPDGDTPTLKGLGDTVFIPLAIHVSPRSSVPTMIAGHPVVDHARIRLVVGDHQIPILDLSKNLSSGQEDMTTGFFVTIPRSQVGSSRIEVWDGSRKIGSFNLLGQVQN